MLIKKCERLTKNIIHKAEVATSYSDQPGAKRPPRRGIEPRSPA